MIASSSQYLVGNATRPSVLASGDTVSQAAIETMINEVAINGQLARLWMNGILLVRMMWMISVCVNMDSTLNIA